MDSPSTIKIPVNKLMFLVDQREVPVTREMAKQWPIIWDKQGEESLVKHQPLPRPICIVLKETIADPLRDEALLEEEQIKWLFLMDLPEIGLAWVVSLVWEDKVARQGIPRKKGEWNEDSEVIKLVVFD